jgi:hypothetical protein
MVRRFGVGRPTVYGWLARRRSGDRREPTARTVSAGCQRVAGEPGQEILPPTARLPNAEGLFTRPPRPACFVL